MLDALRRYAAAAAGITQMTRAGAEAVLKDLQKRGIAQVRDVGRSAQELVNRSVQSRQELLKLISKEIKRQIRGLGMATGDELSRLESRVKELEKAASHASPKKPGRSSAGTRSKI